jgi:hypothetical protein
LKIDRERVLELEDLPNVGKAVAADLRRIGIRKPGELAGTDPFAMYEQLGEVMGMRHDPCMLDVLISAVRFMEGGPPLPWWAFTAERKRTFALGKPKRK